MLEILEISFTICLFKHSFSSSENILNNPFMVKTDISSNCYNCLQSFEINNFVES